MLCCRKKINYTTAKKQVALLQKLVFNLKSEFWVPKSLITFQTTYALHLHIVVLEWAKN